MICPNCFREIPDRSRDCSRCGVNFARWAQGDAPPEATPAQAASRKGKAAKGAPAQRRSRPSGGRFEFRPRRWAAGLFGLAVAGWLGWWAARPALERAAVGGLVVYVSSEDGNPEIYALRPSGGAPVRLTRHPARDTSPVLSRDARRIAFVSDREGSDALWVMQADGSGLTRLPLPPGRHSEPAWSPDGRFIAFVTDPDGAEGPARSDVLVASADGGRVVDVSASAQSEDRQPAWSAGGTRLAFVSDRSGRDRIYTVMADGTALAPLTAGPGPEDSPTWSPDGRRIAFVSEDDVFVAGSDGGPARRLTQGAAESPRASYAVPVWSPDGERLAAFRSAVQRSGGRTLDLAIVRDGVGVETVLAAEPGGVAWADPARLVFLARPRSGRSWLSIQRYSGRQVCLQRLGSEAQAGLRLLDGLTAAALALVSSAPAVDPGLTVLTESGAEALDWAPGAASN